MCGRFYTDIDKEEIIRMMEAVNRAIMNREERERAKTGEIRPTDTAPVYAASGGVTEAALMKWGFPGYLKPGSKAKAAPPIINARSETAADKPTFRRFLDQRCLIPANAYYEWLTLGPKNNPKFRFRPMDPALDTFWMAGLYRVADDTGTPVFTILTMEASASVAPIHNRMPVILGQKEARRAWMKGERDFLGLFREASVQDIQYEPCGEQQMRLI